MTKQSPKQNRMDYTCAFGECCFLDIEMNLTKTFYKILFTDITISRGALPSKQITTFALSLQMEVSLC